MIIRNATYEEMDFLVNCAKQEGWNPGLLDKEAFYACDKNGFWIGIENGNPICCISFVNYEESDFAFVGFYVVLKEFRHQNYGYTLWKHVFEQFPNKNIALDGVVSEVENYKKSGFIVTNHNSRFCGKNIVAHYDNTYLVDAKQVSFPKISTYDTLHFPAKRDDFLEKWLQNSTKAVVHLEKNTIRGFGVIRKCFDGYKIGPLFAENDTIAYNLLCELTHDIKAENIFLDIMDTNEEAKRLVDTFHMEKMFETVRMYTKACPDILWDQVYGITSFELG